MKIDWKLYNYPYKQAFEEVPVQLEYLFTTSDSIEDVELFLYSDLAANIKHQYRIYNVIYPVMECIDDYLAKNLNTKYKMVILYFLEYIFSEHIRDTANLLVTPIRYSLASKAIETFDQEEYLAYLEFKKLYFKHFSDNFQKENIGSIAYYDSIFGKPLQVLPKLLGLIDEEVVNQGFVHDILIGIGYLKYKSQIDITYKDIRLPSITDGFIDTSLGFLGKQCDENILLSLIQNNKETSISWANGYSSVLSACSYFIANSDKSIKRKIEVLSNILEGYTALRDSYNPEFEIDFPPHKYLLEDITSIVYKDFLGKGEIVSVNQLNPVQMFLYDALNEYKTHTYSMLYAGLIPKGIKKEKINDIYDIHSYLE
ncbi:hypothetical protein AAG747_19420 [Rapidithrix thailandica]|uniref:Uncharacterized protein n=1 Tax=Rapidithrix thailandica TaxID=413964 RepID=A0AAW9SCM0_9BACT